MSSFKTQKKGLQPGTVILGENGLPVDTIATIAGTYRIIADTTQSLAYAAGVVTVPVAVDLNPVRFHKSRYTGRLILVTSEGSTYFIDKVSVNPATNTMNIYSDLSYSNVPASIDLAEGWIIAEAEIVNRLATTSSAKIDQIEFRDMQFQIDLDGDPVTVQGTNGNTIEPNADGSVNVQGELELTLEGLSQPSVLNTHLPLANTEYEIVIPKEAKQILVKIRGNALARLSFIFGGTSNSYFTIEYGCFYKWDNLKLNNNLSLYLRTNKSSQIAEILYWT